MFQQMVVVLAVAVVSLVSLVVRVAEAADPTMEEVYQFLIKVAMVERVEAHQVPPALNPQAVVAVVLAQLVEMLHQAAAQVD
jgi:hypothetical protein